MNIAILIFFILCSVIIIKVILELGQMRDKLIVLTNDKTISVYKLPYWLRFLVWLDDLFNCKWQTLCKKVESELEKYTDD